MRKYFSLSVFDIFDIFDRPIVRDPTNRLPTLYQNYTESTPPTRIFDSGSPKAIATLADLLL